MNNIKYSQKNRHGENALNLAVRTGLKIYVEKYINRSDDFSVINEMDGSGRNCITWAKFCIQNVSQSHMKAEYEGIASVFRSFYNINIRYFGVFGRSCRT